MPRFPCLTLSLALVTAVARAQHAPPLVGPTANGPTSAEQKRGSREPATHAPHPELPPALVLDHVRRGNAAFVAALAHGEAPPRPARRPAAAGRYVCAVFTCADAEFDVAATLGLRRSDVLVFRTPGPFVQPEAIALLEHYVAEERLALAIVLTHPECPGANRPGRTPLQRALADRFAEARRRARRDGDTLPRALARSQREALVASSELLQRAVADDRLRVLPAELEPRSAKLMWHTTRADELPLAPVK
ncbi:MAG: hypothetical protein KDE27_01100 [Planctomycetes bacterium]|nr:hypothetical protein [Planctomycetota bacterium]